MNFLAPFFDVRKQSRPCKKKTHIYIYFFFLLFLARRGLVPHRPASPCRRTGGASLTVCGSASPAYHTVTTPPRRPEFHKHFPSTPLALFLYSLRLWPPAQRSAALYVHGFGKPPSYSRGSSMAYWIGPEFCVRACVYVSVCARLCVCAPARMVCACLCGLAISLEWPKARAGSHLIYRRQRVLSRAQRRRRPAKNCSSSEGG